MTIAWQDGDKTSRTGRAHTQEEGTHTQGERKHTRRGHRRRRRFTLGRRHRGEETHEEGKDYIGRRALWRKNNYTMRGDSCHEGSGARGGRGSYRKEIVGQGESALCKGAGMRA